MSPQPSSSPASLQAEGAKLRTTDVATAASCVRRNAAHVLGMLARNRPIRRTKRAASSPPTLPDCLRIARSGVHGRGIFARDFIAQGQRIIEYVGRRITKAEARRRESERLEQVAAGRPAAVFVFELNARHDLDGDVAWNPARLINHSCEPNCEAQLVRGRIWIVARRDLAPGEELTFDYGFPLSDARLHPCRCGTSTCAGFIVKGSQRWRLRRSLVKRRSG